MTANQIDLTAGIAGFLAGALATALLCLSLSSTEPSGWPLLWVLFPPAVLALVIGTIIYGLEPREST